MEKLLAVDDVARLLGLSRFTIYAWAAKRRLPALKVGSRLKFRPSEIQLWVDGQTRPKRSDPLAAATALASSGEPVCCEPLGDAQHDLDRPGRD
jgi:excisionase family DNA binding protein